MHKIKHLITKIILKYFIIRKKFVFSIGLITLVVVIAAGILLYNPSENVEVLAEAQVTGIQATTQNQATETMKNQTITQPFQLSKSQFYLGNKTMSLKLVMSQGERITNGEIGPYGTDYYKGNLVGEVYDEQNKLVCSTDMSKYFTESIVFRDKFIVILDDYNGDGYMDFTVGQYVSSNYNVFNIFTIRENGVISILPVKNSSDGVMCSKYDEYYSTKFLKTKNNYGIKVELYDMEQGKNLEKIYLWIDNKFVPSSDMSELLQKNSINITLNDGSIIKSGDLLKNLDMTIDDTIFIYNNSQHNIEVKNIFEGSFSNSGKNELLIIFGFSPYAHAAGLDFSVAAIYDRKTLDLVSQKSFASDECQFDIVKDNKGLEYLIYSGTTTYQGHSTCMLQLFRLSNNWEQLLPQEDGIFLNGKYRFRILPNGLVSLLEPEFKENDVVGWKKKYYLKWNEVTVKLDNFVPYNLTDTKGKKYFDIDSTSPNGRYAVVSHEWGFDESSYVLVYDISKNKLLNKFDLLAQDFGYVWSPDSKKVCVTKLARIWIDTSIIDIQTKKVVTMTEKGLGVKFDYKLRENRPDPYYQVCEWSPDSKRVLMFYQWTDSNDQRQSGNFIYNLDKQTTTNITQNKPDIGDGEHLEPKKPKGFKW